MMRDPHEQGERLQPFRKDAGDEQFFETLNAALAAAPLPRVSADSTASRLPIIYVVGVPRSGTTLLSQLLSRYLPVGYISNLVARFWRRPSVGIRLARTLLGPDARKAIGFQSNYGVTGEIAGPHEFGYFWRHWLALDSADTHHLPANALGKIDKEGLRYALSSEILAEFDAPVVFKNVICGFHASFLTSVHPNSLFVIVRRDPYQTAASILRSRKARYGSYETWWSLKPSTYPTLVSLKDPVDQVAGQVTDCANEFEIELARPGVRSMSIEFDELWRNPARALDAVCERIGTMTTGIRRIEDTLPELRPPEHPGLPADIEKRLKSRFS
jgi:LPS sulfotransferase NodH